MAPVKALIMRHAEKPDDQGDPNLSPAGRVRAKALVTWFPQTFGRPDFIFAAAVSKRSERPVQTVQPLADALGLEVHAQFADDDCAGILIEVERNPQHVRVCGVVVQVEIVAPIQW